MKKTAVTFLCAVSFLLSACFSPWRPDEAVLILNLGGGADNRAVMPDEETIKNLEHKIHLSGPAEMDIKLEKGVLTARITVTPGRWDITIQAFLDGELYAEGSGSVTITAAQNYPVSIPMRYAGIHYYTVSFDSNGGSNIDVQHVGSGGTATRPNDPHLSGHTFDNWYSNSGLTTVYNFSTSVTGNIILYAKWNPVGTSGFVEKLYLENGAYAIYKFELPAGTVWGDYEMITADYRIDADNITKEIRSVRLMGPYTENDFEQDTNGVYAAKFMPGGDKDENKNAPYIFDDAGISWTNDWNQLGAEADTWFTVEYRLDGSRKYSTYDDSLIPAANAAGPFYFGIGIPGTGDSKDAASFDNGIVQLIRNVTLVAYAGGTNVVSTGSGFAGQTFGSYVDPIVFSWRGGQYEEVQIPSVVYYSVTFNINGGSGTTPAAQTVNVGSGITLPNGSGLSRIGYTFGGWNTNETGTGTDYDAGSSYSPDGNITLYAKWDADTLVYVTGLANKLAWLQTNAHSDSSYILEVNADESINPHTLSYGGSNITITLKGVDSNRTISLSSNGSMFSVNSGVTLILDNNITLEGRDDNTDSLVYVYSGGTLIMNTGSVITGNTKNGYGGGVFVFGGGTLTVSGGDITGNTATGGGGVHIHGTLNMTGGTISGNKTESGGGGGVFVANGTFNMDGGEISGNNAFGGGGGVFVYDGGNFTINRGIITGNITTYGGGVCVANGTFTMSGGEISNNTASGGEIADNIDGGGGGVYVDSNGIFTKTSGTITGYNSDPVNGNVVKDDSGNVSSNLGHAVYAYGKRKETTAGPGVDLYYNYNNGSPTWSGEWDY